MPSLPPTAPAKLIKRRLRAIPIPTLTELALDLQDRDKQALSIRHDAYKFAKLMGRSILIALRADNKIGLKEHVIAWGISADKVLQGVESGGLDLHVPAQLLDKFMLAIQMKAPGATNTSIGSTPTSPTDQQVTPAKEG